MQRTFKMPRVSLGDVLRAMTWLCISAGSYCFLASNSHYDSNHYRQWPYWMRGWMLHSAVFLMVWCPFVAFGTLFGHTKRGMATGIVFYLFLWGLVFLIVPRVK